MHFHSLCFCIIYPKHLESFLDEKKNIVSSIFGCTLPCCRNLWCTMHFLNIIQVYDLQFSSIPKVKYWISTNCVNVSLHISGDIVLMNQTYLLICCEVFSCCGLLPVVCLKGVGLLSHTFLFIETGLNYRIQMWTVMQLTGFTARVFSLDFLVWNWKTYWKYSLQFLMYNW